MSADVEPDTLAVALPAVLRPGAGRGAAARLRPGTLAPGRRRYLAPVGTVAVVLAYAVTTAASGFTIDRLAITGWFLALVVATSLGRPLRTMATRAGAWIAVYVTFFLYDLVRGGSDALGTPVDYTRPLAADRWLTGVVPTLWLQQHVYAGDVHRWFTPLLSLVYISHFLVAYAVMLWLQVRRPGRFWPFVAAFVLTTYVATVAFLLDPSAPPWMVAQDGGMPAVQRTATIGLADLHLWFAAHLVDLGRATLNQVAAFPSLHAAYPALLLVFFWSTSRWWTRLGLAAYAVTMAFMLILTGEHWLIDIVGGWVVAGGSVLVVTRVRWVVPRRVRRGTVTGGSLVGGGL